MTRRVVPALATVFRVIRPDMRGHGGTTVMPGPYTIEQLGSDALGVMQALGLERLPGWARRLCSGLFLAPLIVPAIITAIALYYVRRPLGLIGTTLGLALGHTLMCLPFVIINVGVSLKALDPMLLRAAEGLGAGPWRVFRTVTLPNIAPGLASGAVFAVITSFDGHGRIRRTERTVDGTLESVDATYDALR